MLRVATIIAACTAGLIIGNMIGAASWDAAWERSFFQVIASSCIGVSLWLNGARA